MTNQYDKILKEQLQSLIPALLRKIAGINPVHHQILTPKLQYTLEREADFLQKITLQTGEKLILHIEFQSLNDKHIAQRMLQYCALVYQSYQLPVIQYVFYIGKAKMKMPAQIQFTDFEYKYRLINLHQIPYQTFLDSQNPDEVVWAILGDFEGIAERNVVAQIITRLRELDSSQLKLQQHIRRLEMLSNLRDLQKIVIEEENKMPLVYDMEKDIRFQQGVEKGIEKGMVEAAIAMLKEGLDPLLISKITKIPIAELEKLKKTVETK